MRRFIFIAASLLLRAGFYCVGGVGVPHFKTERALAQGVTLGLGIPKSVPSGGSPPTWTGATSGSSILCGFSTTCAVTGLTVSSGYIVAAVGGSGQGAATGTISAVAFSGCATASLTLIEDSGDDTSGWDSALYAGTVSGISGACTVTGTYSAAGAFQTFAIALGTLSNLNFTTPGTACKGGDAASQNSPFPCTTSITVASGGFGIVGFFQNQNSAITSDNTSVTTTIDSQQNVGTAGTATSLAIGHITTSGAPSMAGVNFAHAATVAAPWR